MSRRQALPHLGITLGVVLAPDATLSSCYPIDIRAVFLLGCCSHPLRDQHTPPRMLSTRCSPLDLSCKGKPFLRVLVFYGTSHLITYFHGNVILLEYCEVSLLLSGGANLWNISRFGRRPSGRLAKPPANSNIEEYLFQWSNALNLNPIQSTLLNGCRSSCIFPDGLRHTPNLEA